MERELKGWSSGQVVNSHSCRPGTPYQSFRTCSEHCRIPLAVITASQYDRNCHNLFQINLLTNLLTLREDKVFSLTT